MRTTSRAFAIGLAAVAAAAGIAVAVRPASAATNGITNPGFESGMAGWSCSSVASAVAGHAHSGTMALQGAASTSDNGQCTQNVAVTPNTAVTLSAFVNGGYVFLGVTGAVNASTFTPDTGGAYQALSVSFNTGSATSLTVFVHGWYGTGTYFADDLSMPGSGGTNPPPPPVQPPPPPPAPPPGPLPRHELTGYWQNFNNGAATLRLRDVSNDFDLIAVAFADTDPAHPGGVTFNVDSGLSAAVGGYTNADFKADVSTLHARGKSVVISVGGQNGTINVGDSNAANNFANSIVSLVNQFGFDGVDIDLENGINADAMGQALRSIRSRVGSRTIITMAPQTLDMQFKTSGYFTLALNIKDILTVVHTQYYNSGAMNGCDGNVVSQGNVDFITAQACILLQSGLRPDQVALGLPASPQAAGSGFVSASVVNAALDCLTRGTNCGRFHPPQTWPTLRGAMTWSTSWDKTNGFAFSRGVKSHLSTLP